MLISALFWNVPVDAIADCSGCKKEQERGERKKQARRWTSTGRCRSRLSGLKMEGDGQLELMFVQCTEAAQKPGRDFIFKVPRKTKIVCTVKKI